MTSYPSPLDDATPRLAKLLLLGIAVTFEYSTALRATCFLNSWITLIVWHFWGSDVGPFDLSHIWVPLILSGNFALRARSFALSASRNGRGITARSVVVAFVWHNPALACHVAYRQWMRWFGPLPLKMLVPKTIWALVAPMVETGDLHLDTMGTTGEGEKKSVSWTAGLFKEGLKVYLMVLFNHLVVKHVSKVLISFALAAQSSGFHSTSKKRRQALGKNRDLEEGKRCLNELALQNCLATL